MTSKKLCLAPMLIAILAGCGGGSKVSKGASAMQYSHEANGKKYSCTASRLNGDVKVTWTIEENGVKSTKEVPMDAKAYHAAYTILMNTPEIRRNKADANAKLDLKANHLIATMVATEQVNEAEAYLVPDANLSPRFKEWLDKLGYPGE